MSIIETIRAGNMTARMAVMFWIGLERGASIIVAADPPSSGKTTTLSALLSFTPPETLVYFTRGQGETFSLPEPSDSYHTYILINEMSDHIPVYTWDDHARHAFNLLESGYSLATTMHADTVEGVVEQLEVDLSIPPRQVARVTFIVPLFIGRAIMPASGPAQGVTRRVNEVAFLQPHGQGYSVSRLARWQRDGDGFEVLAGAEEREAFARWAGLSPEALEAELQRREQFLARLAADGVDSIPEVGEAVESFYEKNLRLGRAG
jgi:hypothetical protein